MKRIVLYCNKPGIMPIVVELPISHDHFFDIDDAETPKKISDISIASKIPIPQLEWIIKRDPESYSWYYRHLKLRMSEERLTKHFDQIAEDNPR